MIEHIVEIGPSFGEVKINERLIRCHACMYHDNKTMRCGYWSDAKCMCLSPNAGYCYRSKERPADE